MKAASPALLPQAQVRVLGRSSSPAREPRTFASIVHCACEPCCPGLPSPGAGEARDAICQRPRQLKASPWAAGSAVQVGFGLPVCLLQRRADGQRQKAGWKQVMTEKNHRDQRKKPSSFRVGRDLGCWRRSRRADGCQARICGPRHVSAQGFIIGRKHKLQQVAPKSPLMHARLDPRRPSGLPAGGQLPTMKCSSGLPQPTRDAFKCESVSKKLP